ncbi:MAG: Metal-dependent hydrolase [Chthonomonadaceae bacterium]|nr:Metal-dependent hydrolase [Chthonomonadaceae bacterium]
MRILTYNTRGSLGTDGRRSTARIAQVVRHLTPDVVCFQEIHRRMVQSGGEDQPALLADALGRPFMFQSNLTVGFGSYGVGIAYRGELLRSREHMLPSKTEQRGALEVQLRDIAGLPRLTVFCTHWGLDSEERSHQALALANSVRAAGHPVVVCGDFNENAEGLAVRALLEATGLLDADTALNRPTFLSDNPTTRIDFVLYSPDLVVRNVEVVPSLASDHLPVLVDLERA